MGKRKHYNDKYTVKEAKRIFFLFMRKNSDVFSRFLYNHCVHHSIKVPKISKEIKVFDDCFRRLSLDDSPLSYFSLRAVTYSLDSLFAWEATPEGNIFWSIIDVKWGNYLTNFIR